MLNKSFKNSNLSLNRETELFTEAFSDQYSYVRETWIGVREKSGNCQGILFCPVCMNPVYSFIVFKYVILILWKDKYILGRIDLYFWGSVEKLVFFRDLGSKGKILLGSRGNYFQGSGEINALFSWIKGAQTPPPWGPHRFVRASELPVCENDKWTLNHALVCLRLWKGY